MIVASIGPLTRASATLRLDDLFKAVLNDRPKQQFACELTHILGRRSHVRYFPWRSYVFADSPICDQRKPPFNFALNAHRSAPLVDPSCIRKERAMNRLIIWVVGGTLLVAAAGLITANAQQSSAPVFIAGGRPVTADAGEIAVRRMVERRRLTQRQVHRSDRIPEWGGQQNGSRLANGSPSGRRRR